MKILVGFGGGHVKNNPAGLYGLVEEAFTSGHSVYLPINGWEGVINNAHIRVDANNYRRLIRKETSLILTGSPRIKLKDTDLEKIAQTYKGKDAVIVVFGGDDNLGEAVKIMEAGIPTMGWDKTMDNDKSVPQICFGYHSFVQEGIEKTLGALQQAVTNRSFAVVTTFARDTDFVPAAIAYYGLADLMLGGEFRQKEITIDALTERVTKVLDANENQYGIRFGTCVASEGAVNIEGYKQFLEGMAKGTKGQRLQFEVKYDSFGHPKLQPELLQIYLGMLLENAGVKSQNFAVTYIGRNGTPSTFDAKWGEKAGRKIVEGIDAGDFGTCAVLDYNSSQANNPNKGFFIRRIPLKQAARKRSLKQLSERLGITPVDYDKMIVTEDMGRLYGHIFGQRREKEQYLERISDSDIVSL